MQIFYMCLLIHVGPVRLASRGTATGKKAGDPFKSSPLGPRANAMPSIILHLHHRCLSRTRRKTNCIMIVFLKNMKHFLFVSALVVSRVSSLLLFQYPDPLPTSAPEKVLTILGTIEVQDHLFVPFTEGAADSSAPLKGIHQLSLEGNLEDTLEFGSSPFETMTGPFPYSDDAFFVMIRETANRGGAPKLTVQIIDAETFSVTNTATISGAPLVDTVQALSNGNILFGKLLSGDDETSLGLLNIEDSTTDWSKSGKEINLKEEPVIDGEYIYAVATAQDGVTAVVNKINVIDGNVATNQPNVKFIQGGGGPIAYDKSKGYLYMITCEDEACMKQITRVDTKTISDDENTKAQVIHMKVVNMLNNWIQTPVALSDGLLACVGTYQIGVFNVTTARVQSEMLWEAEDDGGMDIYPKLAEKLLVYPTPYNLVFRHFATGEIKDNPELDKNYISNDHLHVTNDGSRIYLTVKTAFSSVVYAYANPNLVTDTNTDAPTGVPSNSHGLQGGECFMVLVISSISSMLALWSLAIS